MIDWKPPTGYHAVIRASWNDDDTQFLYVVERAGGEYDLVPSGWNEAAIHADAVSAIARGLEIERELRAKRVINGRSMTAQTRLSVQTGTTWRKRSKRDCAHD